MVGIGGENRFKASGYPEKTADIHSAPKSDPHITGVGGGEGRKSTTKENPTLYLASLHSTAAVVRCSL